MYDMTKRSHTPVHGVCTHLASPHTTPANSTTSPQTAATQQQRTLPGSPQLMIPSAGGSIHGPSVARLAFSPGRKKSATRNWQQVNRTHIYRAVQRNTVRVVWYSFAIWSTNTTLTMSTQKVVPQAWRTQEQNSRVFSRFPHVYVHNHR